MNREKRDLEAIRGKEIPTLKNSLCYQTELYQKSVKAHSDCLSEFSELKSTSALAKSALKTELHLLNGKLASEIGKYMNWDNFNKEFKCSLLKLIKSSLLLKALCLGRS